jgi:hypothetical protein
VWSTKSKGQQLLTISEGKLGMPLCSGQIQSVENVHAIGARQTIITIFFTARKIVVLDVLSQDSKFDWFYFINGIFPDLKRQT